MSNWESIVVSGDDGSQAQAALTTEVKPDGYVHIWAKFHLPGMTNPMQIHAKIELGPIEAALLQQFAPGGGAAVGGRVWRKIKKAARKVARSKLVKGIVRTVKRAIDNPLIKGALAVTPAGAALYATRAAARVAAKAIKGNHKAKAQISGLAAAARRGHPGAQNAMRLIRCGVRAHVPALAAQVSGDEGQAFTVIAGWADGGYPVAVGIGCDRWSVQGDDAETQHEVDALNEFASAGAWEGVRWVASRLGLHSMSNHTTELTARGALLDGRTAMARRFA
jgi:hypothetical protein